MRLTTKSYFDNILTTFSAADGGMSLVNVKAFVEELDNRAKNGDKDAEKVIDMIKHFSNLIIVANK